MKIQYMALLIFLIGCENFENDKIETDNVKKSNTLLTPPVLK
jgi:hypothetical protein